MSKKQGELLLLPNFLSEEKPWSRFLPESVAEAVATVDGVIAESERGGRSYLNQFQLKKPPQKIPIALFEKRGGGGGSDPRHLDFLLEPVEKGETWGVVTDQGLPCIADPGWALVRRAHQKELRVRTFPGPCSITMALVLSGLSGQRFCFHSYLKRERRRHLLDMERASRRDQATQIFMETPYRNNETMQALCDYLAEETLVAVAWSLTTPEEGVLSMPVKRWRRIARPDLDNKPAIFLIAAHQR